MFVLLELIISNFVFACGICTMTKSPFISWQTGIVLRYYYNILYEDFIYHLQSRCLILLLKLYSLVLVSLPFVLSDWSLAIGFCEICNLYFISRSENILTFTGAFDLFCNFVLNLECLN